MSERDFWIQVFLAAFDNLGADSEKAANDADNAVKRLRDSKTNAHE